MDLKVKETRAKAKQPMRAACGEPRVFKTRHFAKQAANAEIEDDELCHAAVELTKGQGQSLGGRVWKKRLNKNLHRSIVITRAGNLWIFTFLFAKNDRENIGAQELEGFKKLAKDYGAASANALDTLLRNGDLKEICNGR